MRRREREVQATWASGRYRGALLTTRAGERLRVLYEGRRGGPAGPDFRDAVLETAGGGRVCGDVEIHLSVRGWAAHGHGGDPRYRGVVVHLVVTGGAEESSPLADGRRVPIALLGEVTCGTTEAAPWPCEGLARRRGTPAVRALLRELGWERFAERARAHERELADIAHRAQADGDDKAGEWSAEDAVLWAAVAESLGYGRDREGLRVAGLRLLDGWAPAAVLEASGVSGVERKRMLGLIELRRRWRVRGPWAEVEGRLRAGTVDAARRGLVEALSVEGGLISRGRVLISLANVVLPYAAARARLHGDAALRERGERVFEALPGLPSNTLTRLLGAQLGLARLPPRALEHAGLQQLWAVHCWQKACGRCPCAGLAAGDSRRAAVARSSADQRRLDDAGA